MATADDASATSATSHEDVLEFWFDGDLDVSTRPRPILLEAPPTLRGKPPPPSMIETTAHR